MPRMGKKGKSQKSKRDKDSQNSFVVANPASFHLVNKHSCSTRKQASSYRPNHDILVIGDGDMSFSLSLASAIGGKKLVATTYDCKKILMEKYGASGVASNVKCLLETGATVLHRVDGTNLQDCKPLIVKGKPRRFNNIIFNFPHLGGSSDEDVENNKQLLRDFFHSARPFLKPTIGEVHVALRNTSFYDAWKIGEQANGFGYIKKSALPFKSSDFPGFEPQRTHPAARAVAAIDNAIDHVFRLKPSIMAKLAKISENPKTIQTYDSAGKLQNHEDEEIEVEAQDTIQATPTVTEVPPKPMNNPKEKKISRKRKRSLDMIEEAEIATSSERQGLIMGALFHSIMPTAKKAKLDNTNNEIKPKITPDIIPTPALTRSKSKKQKKPKRSKPKSAWAAMMKARNE
eukprot:TRINITY_DN779910_c0_g1_i1.p1 TRINITY_DN779910_c0_g1~~TRINITY_DN779910_c0_g1_i1.p1  ORF type:complete len:414 (+),score=85.62 TRINITY_DN779910_c0_g1_i1:37-1242(+)